MSDANSSQPKPKQVPSADADPTRSVAFHGTMSLPAAVQAQQVETESSASASSVVALTVGRKFGAYEILRKLGEGGMGAVYLARHAMLDKLVAVKVLPPHQTSDPEAVLRFQREMRAVGQIAHPNVVGAMDAGNVDGLPYLVMEYVEGVDLAKFIQRRGPLSARDACVLIRQAALGLAAAHERGLIHRDIKPSNLLVTKTGQLKILDLGLAKLLSDDAAQLQLTQTGRIVGTPDYMAPEQWDSSGDVDARTDLYALGCTLYLVLTGKSPFRNTRRSSLREIMNAHLLEPPPSLTELRPDVPAVLSELCRRLMAKSPDERIGSARELASQLEQIERLSLTLPTGLGSPLGFELPASAGDSSVEPADAETDADGRRTTRRGEATDATVIRRRRLLRRMLLAGVACIAAVLLGLAINSMFDRKPGDAKSPTNAPPNRPEPAIAPFKSDQALVHQQRWAAHLGVPIEFESSIGMKFRLIPPGEFLMGSRELELQSALSVVGDHPGGRECVASEGPRHKVVLTKPMFLGATEVTQKQYQAATSENPAHYSPAGAGRNAIADEDAGSLPVESVSWFDVAALCMKLSEDEKLSPCYARSGGMIKVVEGIGYRMPTEAEWEFACRAGTNSSYWTGDDPESFARAAWGRDNSGDRPHPVGLLRANAFGLFDIHGNVSEWVADRWDSNCYAQAAASGDVDPLRTFTTEAHGTVRGGYWSCDPTLARAASRANADRSFRGGIIGCRLAISIDGVKEVLRRREQTAAEAKSGKHGGAERETASEAKADDKTKTDDDSKTEDAAKTAK